MLKGLNICADAVSGTLGPKGRNAFIEQKFENMITNDGATIAANIELPDKFEDLGARIIRNVSSQTNDDAGDGTTTTALLTQSIIHESVECSENPMAIRASLIEAKDRVVELLKSKSHPASKEELLSVALISSENEKIGKSILELVDKLGENAVINIDDSKTFETYSEVQSGYDASVGFISPYFINDKNTGRAVFENVHVLVSEKKISNLIDFQRLAQQFEDNHIGQCVIVCDDIEDSMVGFFATNKIKGIFQSVVIKAHGEMLEDIEGATGATAIADRNGVNFQNIRLEHLGKADRVVVDQKKSLFIGKSVAGSLRATELDKQAENETNDYRKKKLRDRAAKLRGGIGTIRIGASTDFERDYLKLKAEDAVKAVQAAIEEGVVEGGGMALWEIANELPGDTIGEKILKSSLTAPLRKILDNAGADYGVISLSLTKGVGYDAKEGKIINLKESGIVDPIKVERCALENAVSAASTFITAFVAITENEEPRK